MASRPLEGQQDKFRHRIANIKLEPSTSNNEVTLKVLVDNQEAHRLPPIKPGGLLSWDWVVPCGVNPSSVVELRVYEKHFLQVKRVGTVKYAVLTVAGLLEASFEFDPNQIKVTLLFLTPEAAKEALATTLAQVQEQEKTKRPLERLGPTRDAFKAILNFGQAVSELHPAAKIAFGVCNIAWDTFEKQEQCDANVERLVVGLAGMLPFVNQVEEAAKLSQLQKTVATMMSLIEDALVFVVQYRSDGGSLQSLRAFVSSKAQDQVQDLLDKFQRLKEDFDRGVGVQALGTVEFVREVLLTGAQRALLNELKPVGSARYDSARACLPGTRAGIIKEIVDWSQRRDTSEAFLWVHGQAGLGKSSIATSVCQQLDSQGLLAAGFFCKRDSSERRDPQKVLATIVRGLASRHPGYAQAVAVAIQRDSQLCSSPIQMQYNSLIKGPLEISAQVAPSANLVVIVDALDECGTNESRRQLLAYLHLMSQLVPWLKLVVTSRPDPDIQSFFGDRTTTGVSKRNVYEYYASDDINLFIQHPLDRTCRWALHLGQDCVRAYP
ncbi:hypothetical protein BDV93DRAFT_527490, partial [Ceratobasidium sp. AG-I]